MKTSMSQTVTSRNFDNNEVETLAGVFQAAWLQATERGWRGLDPALNRHLLSIFIVGRSQEIGLDRDQLLKDAINFLVDNHRHSAIHLVDAD